MAKQPKVVVYEASPGDWHWRLVAANGRKVGPGGEGFTSERDAWRAWETHVRIVLEIVERDSL